MIDFHTHLDLYPDPLKVARDTARRNTFTLAVTTSPRAWLTTSKVFAVYENIGVALGLHPEIVAKKKNECDLLIKLVRDAKYIGEVGLDGSARYRSSFEDQLEIFEKLLRECSRLGGRIMSLHSRSAATKLLQLLEKYPDSGTPVLHWFSGSTRELEKAIELGCWFSVGPAMIKSARGRQILEKIPLNRLLPESDGPFASINGKTVMPWDSNEIINVRAQMTPDKSIDFNSAIEENLKTLIRPYTSSTLF